MNRRPLSNPTRAPRAVPGPWAVVTTAAAAAAAIIAGCTVGPNYKPPAVSVPEQYGEAAAATQPTTQPTTATTRPVDVVQWWTTFEDPELNSLIDRAVKQNLDYKNAMVRVIQSRAQYGVTSADQYPTVNAVAGYTHSRSSGNLNTTAKTSSLSTGSGSTGNGSGSTGNGSGSTGNGSGTGTGTGGTTSGGTTSSSFSLSTGGRESNLYQIGFDASWELDVFGGIRRSVEAAGYDVQTQEEARRNTLVTLLSEVARDYIQLRGFQRELALAQQNYKSQSQTLELIRTKFRAGLSNDLGVAQQEAQVATTAATIPTFDQEVHQSIHAIGVLLGQTPDSLYDELAPDAAIPIGPAAVPPGLPSELLRRRPDVRQAERALAAATARIGVATADLFPKFTLTGTFGTESDKVARLLDWNSRYFSIGPALSWPIFDAGRIRYNIKVQDALQQEALLTYQQTILTSLQDVEDSLVAYNREQLRRQVLSDAVASNQRAVNLSTDLYNRGLSDFLSVLTSEEALFSAQDALARSEAQVSANLVAVYKALGGGWESQEPPPPPPKQ